jgi:hypothetical protein
VVLPDLPVTGHLLSSFIIFTPFVEMVYIDFIDPTGS